jgi:hypothetical protein
MMMHGLANPKKSQKIIDIQKFSFFVHENTRRLIVTEMTCGIAVSFFAVFRQPVTQEALFNPTPSTADYVCGCVCGGGGSQSGARIKFSSGISVLFVSTIHQCSILIH